MTYRPFLNAFSFLKPASIVGGRLPHEKGYPPCFLAGIMHLVFPGLWSVPVR